MKKLIILNLFIALCLIISCNPDGKKAVQQKESVNSADSNKVDAKRDESDYSGIFKSTGCKIIITIIKEGSGYKYAIAGDNTAYTGDITVTAEDGNNYLNFSGRIGDNPDNSLRALFKNNTLTIQNYGNSINEFIYFKECDAKYLEFVKQ